MTAEEFRARWTGHVPKVQDVTGEYAVLVPLVERPEGLCLLYEVRADTLGRQPGEVCFPGGRLEPGEDAVSCALRETWEELGIPRPAVEVVAELDWLTHQGGFVLYPLIPQVGEDFPYARIGFPQGYRWRGGRVEVPIYAWEGRAIWGLTGRITRRLLEGMP